MSQFVRDVESRSLLNATPKKINMGDIGSVPISLPPTIKEQRAIAAMLSDVDGLIRSLDMLIAKKRAIKQAAMQKLLRSKKGWVVKKLGELFDISAGGDLRNASILKLMTVIIVIPFIQTP